MVLFLVIIHLLYSIYTGMISIHEVRRTVSSYLNTVLPREAVANMFGHLPTTNERFYDYDISSRSVKVEALEKLSSNIINFSAYSKIEKARKAQ